MVRYPQVTFAKKSFKINYLTVLQHVCLGTEDNNGPITLSDKNYEI